MTANIPSGVFLQIYRSELPGSNQKERIDSLAEYVGKYNNRQARGFGIVRGIVVHGFPRDLTRNWRSWSSRIADLGWIALASWGADGSLDEDETALTAEEKGECIGTVLAHEDCAAGLVDAEGKWDSDSGPGDDMDEQGALALMRKVRQIAPHKPLGDQPWFAIDSHGELRRKPMPIDKGGVFAGFPVDEFATGIDWGRFRQAYCNNFKREYGDLRYKKVFSWMNRDWAKIEPAMAAAGLSRPLRVTIQGYGWRLQDEVDCIVRETVTNSSEMVIWNEPLPDLTTRKALLIASRLVEEGHARPCVEPKDAIMAYQAAYNARSVKKMTLKVDGIAGEQTYSSML